LFLLFPPGHTTGPSWQAQLPQLVQQVQQVQQVQVLPGDGNSEINSLIIIDQNKMIISFDQFKDHKSK